MANFKLYIISSSGLIDCYNFEYHHNKKKKVAVETNYNHLFIRSTLSTDRWTSQEKTVFWGSSSQITLPTNQKYEKKREAEVRQNGCGQEKEVCHKPQCTVCFPPVWTLENPWSRVQAQIKLLDDDDDDGWGPPLSSNNHWMPKLQVSSFAV